MTQNPVTKYFSQGLVLRCLIGLSLFAFSMELCARIDDNIKYQAPLIGVYSPDILRERDHDGVKHNVPNIRFEKWQINEFGFRGQAFPVEKPEGVKRIVCMGTSESFGLYEDAGKEWPSQLAEMLSGKEGYQVINASVVGLSLPQFAPYIEKYVLRFQPDIVILYLNPYFSAQESLVEKASVAQRVPEPPPRWKPKGRPTQGFSIMPRLAAKMKVAVKGALPPSLVRRYQLWKLSGEIKTLEDKELKGKKPADNMPEGVLESFKKDLIRLVTFLKDRRIQVVLSSYPVLISYDNLEKYQEIFLDNRRFSIRLSLKGMIEIPSQCNAQIESVAREFGIAFVDNAGRIPRTTEFFGDNVHYTNKGAQQVGAQFKHLLLMQ